MHEPKSWTVPDSTLRGYSSSVLLFSPPRVFVCACVGLRVCVSVSLCVMGLYA